MSTLDVDLLSAVQVHHRELWTGTVQRELCGVQISDLVLWILNDSKCSALTFQKSDKMDRNGYTFAELTDMHLAYRAALGNAEEARRIYHEWFPNGRLPGAHMFINNDQRLRDRGSLSQRFFTFF